MQLFIDPSGGIAGDMFAAALISAGADQLIMEDTMYKAAAKLGKASVKYVTTSDGAGRLLIEVEHEHKHLSGHEAKHLLAAIFEELDMDAVYREFGQRALQILVDAEKKAHAENVFLTDHLHSHGHDHGDSHHHHHDKKNHHHHHEQEDAFLHEAQDILIDIVGAAYGLQLLEAPVEATLLSPVSLGGGKVTFSHGTLDVPAPATKNIIQGFWVPSQLGPIDIELCTPTGASILAALKAVKVAPMPQLPLLATGKSRGGKDLPIPPLGIYLVE